MLVDHRQQQLKPSINLYRPVHERLTPLPVMQRAHIDSGRHMPYDNYMISAAGLTSVSAEVGESTADATASETMLLAGTHPINTPNLRPMELMPQREGTGLRALSVFSGGGGLDLGFERAGYRHAASFEILTDAAATLKKARPDWDVHGGSDGDVTGVDWRSWRGLADVVHGGPPCQPFSVAGRQAGADDHRDMWPAMVDCLLGVRPRAFVAENVPALATDKFTDYVRERILSPLAPHFHIRTLLLSAPDFGVPQSRRRMLLVGFARADDAERFTPPAPTHQRYQPGTLGPGGPPAGMGMRDALGLPDIGFDALCPTIRSGLTGPHHTTSIINSSTSVRTYARLQVWPNGVAATRARAHAFAAANGHFRLAIPDVAVLQGFPEQWPLVGAIYMQLGQLGNAVPPPMAYAVATAVAAALR